MHRRMLFAVAAAASVAVLVSVALVSGTTAPDRTPDSSAADPRRPAPVDLRPPVDRYVALGDSFTAGPFIPCVDASRTACLRSSANYPAVLAGWLQARRVVDVSCSGADTAELALRQLRAVTPGTDLVTLGVGGNDFGLFGSLVGQCPALSSTDPTGTPCRNAFTTPAGDKLLTRLPLVLQRLVGLLDEVALRAPEAVVALVGYPRLVPDRTAAPERTCPELPFAAGDYAWADRVERGLNAALAAAAARAGAVFVDTYRTSRGHDVCAGDAAWVNGQGTAPTRALAYDPYAAGMVGSAAAAYETLTGRVPTAAMVRRAGGLTDRRSPGTLSLHGQRVIAALLGAGPETGPRSD